MLFVGAALGTPPMPGICGRETAIEEAGTDQRRITHHPAIAVFRNCVAAVLIARDPRPPSPTQSSHRGAAGEPIAFQRPAPGPARCAKPSAPMLGNRPSTSRIEWPRSASGARYVGGPAIERSGLLVLFALPACQNPVGLPDRRRGGRRGSKSGDGVEQSPAMSHQLHAEIF